MHYLQLSSLTEPNMLIQKRLIVKRNIPLPWGRCLSQNHGSGTQLQDNQSRKSSWWVWCIAKPWSPLELEQPCKPEGENKNENVRRNKLATTQILNTGKYQRKLNTFLVRSVLITDDFPTFGYPTKPTDTACLSLFRRANCLRTERSDPWNKPSQDQRYIKRITMLITRSEAFMIKKPFQMTC